MPLWNIHAPEGLYTPEDKQGIATIVTRLYEKYGEMPRFYVSILFHDHPPENFYMGGEPAEKFVRIWMDHIALHVGAEIHGQWLAVVDTSLASYLTERGIDYEVHGDETPRTMWSINGILPPPTGSDDETRWREENTPSPLTST